MTSLILACENVVKSYRQGPQVIDVLNGIELQIAPAQHLAIVGASGSGKSTLLNVLGGLDQPDQGTVTINGKPFSSCGDNARGEIRNHSLGFVYQFHHLLPEFNALENVALPPLIGGRKKREARQLAEDMLDKVGLSHRLDHKPSELSGGERQRVAIARALVNSPACVLMDEPTGNLDAKNAESIQNLMQSLSQSLNTSFVVVTHDEHFAHSMDSVLELQDGKLRPLATTVTAS